MKIRVSDIRVKNRIRKQPGDLSALKESINRVGLLHPIIIDLDNRLIAGERRLEAVQQLGWEHVEVKIVDIRNKKDRILIEADENISRLDFTNDELIRSHELIKRYSRSGIFWRFIAWILDLIDKLRGK
ncbi:MAG: ParB N-terminal domain-containing protein [Leptospira sp.]|nr:ParB N-terminal domain-containing protein [Leptospira sp.]